MRRRIMHGRRRRRSPVKSSWGQRTFGAAFGTSTESNSEEEALELHKKNSNDESSQGATNKNAATAAGEAAKATKQASQTNEQDHDNTHSHPPAAFESEEEGQEAPQGMLGAAATARKARRKPSSSWGRKTFGW